MKKVLTLTAALLGLSAVAEATPRISAQSIIVNPVQTNVGVRVWTDRDPAGNAVPNYYPGENIRLSVSTTRDAYVYLFNVDPQGRVDMVLPNQYNGGDNYVRANTIKTFPQAGALFTFTIDAPYGMNKVLALASTMPLNMNDIATFTQQNSLATVNVQGQGQLAQALSIVVSPVAQNTWNTDTAFYNVAAARAVAPVRPAPLTQPPVYVQPAPVYVQPAPVYVQPAPVVQPVQNSFPWLQLLNWFTNVAVTPTTNLQNVHEQYAGQLRAQGYRLVTINEYAGQIRSQWQRGYDQATLEVTQRGSNVEVRIVRN